MEAYVRFIAASSILLLVTACAPAHIGRVFGVGTKIFRTEGKVYVQEIACDMPRCYAQTRTILESRGAKLFQTNRKKTLLIMYQGNELFKQCNSMTEIAIFFTPLDSYRTRVEVSSLNHDLASCVATIVFEGLTKRTVS